MKVASYRDFAVVGEMKRSFNMEGHPTLFERLNERIDSLLTRLASAEGSLEVLRNENIMLKAENEAKGNEISGLYEELSLKERELDTVLKKIEAVLGR